MIAANLEPVQLERDFRALCAKRGITIKAKLTAMIKRELQREAERNEASNRSQRDSRVRAAS